MRRYFRLGLTILILTVLFTGILSLRAVLPYYKETVVEAKEQPHSEEPATDPVVEVIPEDELPTDSEAETDPEKVPTEKPPQEEEPEAPVVIDEVQKVAYLTFDDGPSPGVTPLILDILKEQNIKATFFVIGKLAETHPELLLRIQEEGHLISNHTYTHNYKSIYSNPQSFLAELRKTDGVLEGILGDGYQSKIIRFPGGSFGERLKPFREAVQEAGYFSIDWNVLNGDAEARVVSPQRQLERIKETLQNKKEAVVLMHDSGTKENTAEALPAIIEHLRSQGYIFKTLAHYEF